MNTTQEIPQSERRYREIKRTVDASYPQGWFVAVADDRILAADADFHELENQLLTQGHDPRQVLVVQAGIDIPEYVTIFRG